MLNNYWLAPGRCFGLQQLQHPTQSYQELQRESVMECVAMGDAFLVILLQRAQTNRAKMLQ